MKIIAYTITSMIATMNIVLAGKIGGIQLCLLVIMLMVLCHRVIMGKE